MHSRSLSWLAVVAASLIIALVVMFAFWPVKEDEPSNYIADKTYKFSIITTTGLMAANNPAIRNDQLTQRQVLIDAIRSEVETKGGKLFLLSGGELGGADLLNHHNQLGYHAVAASTQFFSEPMRSIRSKQAAAHFPFLSANLYESETGLPIFDAYALFDVDGLRIAVVGITQPKSADADSEKHLHGIDLIDPALSLAELVPSLRDQADIVIATTHPTDYVSSSKALSTLTGIDLLIDSHRADNIRHILNTSRPDQPDCHSTVDRIDMEFRNGELRKTNSITINLCNNQLKSKSC